MATDASTTLYASLGDLAHHPKSDDGIMMIERVGQPYSRPLHDREAGRIDGGQLVQVGAPEVVPRLLQIA